MRTGSCRAALWISLLALAAGPTCGPVAAGNPCGLTEPSCASDTEAFGCEGPDIVSLPCQSFEVCADGEGCVDRVCTPGQIECVDSATERRCVAPGHGWEELACNPGVGCTAGGCAPPVCVENQRTCLGTDQVGICNATGTAFDPLLLCSDSDPTSICHDGQCLTACDAARATDSYVGCEYYAVDLPNYGNNVDNKDFGIIVGNPSETHTAHVTISDAQGVLTTLDVAPLSAASFSQPPVRLHNTPGAGVWPRAYLIQSDRPVAAYQFNSLTTIGAASTDASLLFASHTLATKYFAMDYTGFGSGSGDNFVAVYATEAGTQVTVIPTVPVRGSEPGSTQMVPASGAGVPITVTLGPFDVFVVMADGVGADLTGTQVEASAPIGVFGGNRCTQVPAGFLYCDHLEQQIFPRQAIGTTYVVGKTHARQYCDVEDRVRVLADADGTTITLEPPVAGPFTLNAGEWREFGITDHVIISSDQPVLVGQYIRSSNAGDCNEEGDPAFILQVPIEQYRTDYVFLTPQTYTTDYISLIAPLGTTVELDGQPVTLSGVEVGTSGHSVTDIVIQDGPHRLFATDKVGVIIYGYGGPSGADPNGVVNVSYGYPGGLDLVAINPVE